MGIINASLHGGDCSTRMRCVDTFCWHLSLIYLYRKDAWNVPVSFFLNVVISLSLNDSARNILNDVLKIYGLVGSLLFNGFTVLDGFLVSVILSSVISPTGGMVMCFSSSQVSILHLQKICWSCFLLVASLTEPSAVFVIHLTVFNMLFPCDSSLFTKKTSVTEKELALWLLTDMLFSLFWGAYITPFWLVLLIQNSAIIHKVVQCVIPMQIRYILIYFSHHIRIGPLHMFNLFSSWICTPCQPHKVISGHITVTVSYEQKAGSLFYTEHNQ